MLLSVTPESVFLIDGADSRPQDTAVDDAGNLYLIGQFSGELDFDAGPGEYLLMGTGGEDNTFVAKYSSEGVIQWAIGFGGSDGVWSAGLAVDGSQNVYVTGAFSGQADFGGTTLTAVTGNDLFATKLDVSGNVLWSVSMDRNMKDIGSSIAVDAAGAYVSGTMHDKGLVAKLDPDTGAVEWTQFVDSNSGIMLGLRNLALDDDGDLYLSGDFHGTTTFGDITLKASKLKGTLASDAFLAKMDADGNFLWVRQMGGIGDDQVVDMAIDSDNLFLTGNYGSDPRISGHEEFPADFGDFTLTSNGEQDIFVVKTDLNGDVLWATGFGGTGYIDNGTGIAVDGMENVFVTGVFTGSVNFGDQTFVAEGTSRDAFTVHIDDFGNIAAAWQVTGPVSEYSNSVSVDGSGGLYTAGYIRSEATFPTGQTLTVPYGDSVSYVMRFVPEDPNNTPPTADDDTAGTYEDTAVVIAVLSNDSDLDEGDVIRVSGITQGANGSVVNNGDTVTYTPNADFNGTDTFTYTISDGNGGTATATVTVDVIAQPDAPVAVDDAVSTTEDTPVTGNVLSNDSDADGDPLTAAVLAYPADGTLGAFDSDGSFTYTPNAGTTTDSFTYTVSDGNGGTDIGTVTINVTAANPSQISINDVSKREGRLGRETAFKFAVTRSGDTSQVITINYATIDGTATVADTDYAETFGSLTFGVGETAKTISVTVHGDSKAEYDEFFTVQLTDQYSNVIVGTGTIINDDKGDPDAQASATDAALAAWAVADSSDDEENDLLALQAADDLALMLVE